MTDPVVEMSGITVEFSGVRVLDGVDLALYPGEVHALMGENGAGKSTLIGALTGTLPILSGRCASAARSGCRSAWRAAGPRASRRCSRRRT
nr:hypothetical protein GCM10025732_32830 [Glycomyces mayteni]